MMWTIARELQEIVKREGQGEYSGREGGKEMTEGTGRVGRRARKGNGNRGPGVHLRIPQSLQNPRSNCQYGPISWSFMHFESRLVEYRQVYRAILLCLL